MVTLGHQRVDPVLDHITDADDCRQSTVSNNGHMADPSVSHHLSQLFDRVALLAAVHLARHDDGDGAIEHGRPRPAHVTDHVTFTDDAIHRRPVGADDDRADPVLVEHLQQPSDSVIRADRDDLGPLVTQHVGDLHVPTVDGTGATRQPNATQPMTFARCKRLHRSPGIRDTGSGSGSRAAFTTDRPARSCR